MFKRSLEVKNLGKKVLDKFSPKPKMDVEVVKSTPRVYQVSDINEYGYMFEYDQQLIAESGLFVAGMHLIAFQSACALTGDSIIYIPRIIYDDNFLQLSETSRKFIVEHELGHFELHQERMINEITERDITVEYQADRFAADQVGVDAAKEALAELHAMMIKNNYDINSYSSVEILKRIKNLERLEERGKFSQE